jgi:hypothetical protein
MVRLQAVNGRNDPTDIGHISDCIERAVAGVGFGQGGSLTACRKCEHFNSRGHIWGSVMTLLEIHAM